MNRIFVIVVALGLLVLGAGVLALGAFPPTVRQHPVQQVLPNDRFKGE